VGFRKMTSRPIAIASLLCLISLLSCERAQPDGDLAEVNDVTSSYFLGEYSTRPGECQTQRVHITLNEIRIQTKGQPEQSAKFIRSQAAGNGGMGDLVEAASTAHLASFGGERSLIWLTQPVDPTEKGTIHFAAYGLEHWPKGDLLESVNLSDPSIEFHLFPCALETRKLN